MDEPSVAFSVEGKTFRSPIGVFSILGVCALAGAILCLLQLVTRPLTLSNAVPLLFGGVGGLIGLAAGLGRSRTVTCQEGGSCSGSAATTGPNGNTVTRQGSVNW